jgi:serine/tyrosine/threonine adenylyltransferase
LINSSNPVLIPRNHRIEEVIKAAVEQDDFVPFYTFHAALSTPYVDRPEFAAYQKPPTAEEQVFQTFCGT